MNGQLYVKNCIIIRINSNASVRYKLSKNFKAVRSDYHIANHPLYVLTHLTTV